MTRGTIALVVTLAMAGCGSHASPEDACENMAHCQVLELYKCAAWLDVYAASVDCLDTLASGECDDLTAGDGQLWVSSCFEPCTEETWIECLGPTKFTKCSEINGQLWQTVWPCFCLVSIGQCNEETAWCDCPGDNPGSM